MKDDLSKGAAALSSNLEISEEEANKILSKISHPTPEEQLSKDYVFSLNQETIENGGGIIKSINTTAEFLHDKGNISNIPDGKKFIDNSILTELEK